MILCIDWNRNWANITTLGYFIYFLSMQTKNQIRDSIKHLYFEEKKNPFK